MLKQVRAFLVGIKEWRMPYAYGIETFRELDAYDAGATLARRIFG